MGGGGEGNLRKEEKQGLVKGETLCGGAGKEKKP